MLKNPAVLQCGITLRDVQADEIKVFANLRYFGNRLIPSDVRVALLTAVVALLFYALAASNGASGVAPGNDATLAAIRPVLGLLGVALFATTIYGVGSAGRKPSQ